MEETMNIAIDGPASSGKSTVAKLLAKDLGITYLDTGAMYRAITYLALSKKVDLKDETKLQQLAKSADIKFMTSDDGQKVFLNGLDVTQQIRTEVVSQNVSLVSSYKSVREELVRKQQAFITKGGIVMDGRDIGTVVMPNADLKIFMVASVEIRAKRRHLENLERGFKSDYEAIKEQIATRDEYDQNRANSPLTKADDAILLDSSHMTVPEVVAEIKKLLVTKKLV
ncbi:MAG TPA: (d)CMP kinase [Bavariicoccus seileri]|uniref:Cytidylate kinase n=2 Tax=Bavariicoccus seileri TaxID=549685 RepID=A0A3D4S5J5_9ENTE|nr:(d)CMP kinase [Bavariicoccus seileri]